MLEGQQLPCQGYLQAGLHQANLAPLVVLAASALSLLAAYRAGKDRIGDGIAALAFLLLVALSAVDDRLFPLAYACSVLLLFLRETLWLQLRGGAPALLLYWIAPAYSLSLIHI